MKLMPNGGTTLNLIEIIEILRVYETLRAHGLDLLLKDCLSNSARKDLHTTDGNNVLLGNTARQLGFKLVVTRRQSRADRGSGIITKSGYRTNKENK